MKFINIQNIKDIIRTSLEIEILNNKYKINNKEIISHKNLKLLDISGHEYLVYLYKNEIIKIHRRHLQRIYSLDEKNIISLSKIKTSRILMPKYPIYNIKGNIEGYSMIPVLEKKDISQEIMDNFLNEIYIINTDMNILNDKLIMLKDLHPGNVIYNGKIFIVDSGRYLDLNLQKYSSDKEHIVKQNNILEMNNFLYSYIMNDLLKKCSKEEKKLYLLSINIYFHNLAINLNTNRYLDVIENTCSRDMTVHEYSKYLFKKIQN